MGAGIVQIDRFSAPKAWLDQIGQNAGPASGRARLFTLLDGLAAVGFAAGLAFGIDAIAARRGALALSLWLLLAIVAMVARGLLARAAGTAGARAAAQAKAGVRANLARAVFGGARRPTGEAATALVEGVEALDGHVARFLPARLSAAVLPLVLIAVAAIASPICAAILLATLVPFVAAMMLAGTAAAAESRAQFLALERLSGLFLDRVRALPVVLTFQAEGTTTAALRRSASELAERTIRVLRVAFISSAALEFFAALSVALVAVYCGFNLLRLLPFPVPETLDLKRAFFVLALAPEVYAPMRRLAATYHDRQAAEAAAASLSTFEPPVARLAAPPLTQAPTIRFEGVSVRYADADAPALRGFDLTARAGTITALLGPSGVGKSSILNLLLELAPLSAGRILVDGAERPDLARDIAWAGQSPLILPASIADNIALARREATRPEIEAAARAVGLILDRPGGLDFVLDERGSGLSGGERRRLSLARALLKPAPILLLDEPTANLDALAEAQLLAAIREAAKGRTTLIATHSEAVAALADQVVRL
ncbi:MULTISPECIES: thiol reductant ABC exporter subunit CydD [unclassified Caulobacter]|uniref:thiol reductant ABC exporter subunit CydD n=1 Tax=unclassified Caulobacter TaxID=2648921 RepID=UPI0006F46BED|nr:MULTISPECIES: thiol reductant ABC exporter subunit CydD [unclassified Caulobacter]KQV55795.1 ABC transporter ATP-binding protein [Caulobacter sp. Root342]KQV71032.1 ABC transporter ATP-binding protein [Caulobacter sp. Root343]